MVDNRNDKKILVGNHRGKTQIGTGRRRCEDDIKVAGKEIESFIGFSAEISGCFL